MSPPPTPSAKDEDDFERWTYASTMSTNMTMSNLPGPGRTLGKLYSSAGRSLEKSFGRLAHAAGYGPFAASQRLVALCGQPSGQPLWLSWEHISVGKDDYMKGLLKLQDDAMPDCWRLLKYAK